MKVYILSLILMLCAVLALAAYAEEMFIYPNDGQDHEQQEKDRFECYSWAKNHSGFDPMSLPEASTPPPSESKKSGGVVKGAAGGAIVGAIVGDSSKYAKRGAAAGALIGGARQSSKNQEIEKNRKDWERQQAAEYANSRNNYNRAFSACMEGRKYTVK